MRRAIRIVSALALAAAMTSGCGDDDNAGVDGGGDGDDGGAADAPFGGADAAPYDGPVLKRPSKSGTIAITGDDNFVVMINPEDDSISIFETATNTRTARVTVGDEPSSVVIGPDDKTAYVSNRAAATVVKVTGIDTASPTVGAPLEVGSEPVGVALSPTGQTLYVAEFAEGRVAVIRTSDMQEVGNIPAPKNPRALAVTNDGDTDESDETIVVPEFFGEKNDAAEGTDVSRNGRIRLYNSSDLAPQTPIQLVPLDSGFRAAGVNDGPTSMTSPNQLWAVQIIGNKIYVPSVSASPDAPLNFQVNVQPVAYVGDLAAHAEDKSGLGTANLALLVNQQVPDSATRLFLADIVDIGFVGNATAYYLSRGADAIQRVVYEGESPELGSDQNDQIDLNIVPGEGQQRCQTPTGIVIRHTGGRAFINCWVTRSLGVINLADQALIQTVESAPLSVSEQDVQLGRRFFFTARGRWSDHGWSDCGSCHPDGLSDNITWKFGAGPRQTTSMDGSYSHGPGAQKQRVFNWTGIFDEIHDFERNTRGVSGGKGALTTAPCGNPATEVRIDIGAGPTAIGGLARPFRELQDETPSCVDDWDKVEAYAKTIRPPRGLKFLDQASVARGAVLFGAGAQGNPAGCVKCHGGPGWTASRLFFTPEEDRNAQLLDDVFAEPAAWPDGADTRWNLHTRQVAAQPAGADTFGDPPAPTAVAPPQVACVIRNVRTFGVPGDDAATLTLEKKDNGGRAQGRGGYNIPSLYGISLGAPYLHHGGANDLSELFNDEAWEDHLAAGSAVWLQGDEADVDAAKADLINFLLSIDATTAEQALTAGFEGCPADE